MQQHDFSSPTKNGLRVELQMEIGVLFLDPIQDSADWVPHPTASQSV
jgi:hypothetical protein